MQLIESNIKPARQPVTKVNYKVEIREIIALEQELNKLKRLFATASHIMSEYNAKTLFRLCYIKDQLKLEITTHLQKHKYDSNSVSVSRVNSIFKQRLCYDIFDLKIRLDAFKSKLFKAPNKNHYIL